MEWLGSSWLSEEALQFLKYIFGKEPGKPGHNYQAHQVLVFRSNLTAKADKTEVNGKGEEQSEGCTHKRLYEV